MAKAEKAKSGKKSPSSRQDTKTGIPEELETVWDTDIAKAFKALRPQQQDFLIAYLNTGNASEAYRRAYNPLAKDNLASAAGSQALSSISMEVILSKFANQKTAMLFKVINGYNEMAEATKPNWVKDEKGQYENAGDDPDWQARKEALLGIRKVFGIDAADKVDHSGQVSVTHNYDIPNKRPVGT